MESLFERLLSYYNLTKEEYDKRVLPPSFTSIPQINDDPMVQKAIDRLAKAKANHEKVLIYGDYDTDGISSCSILLRSLKEFGIDASGYLPSRYLDGYGLTSENVMKIASKGFTLIFTCDNGVTAHDALKTAKEFGIEVMILDHHEFDSVKPECEIIIHPDLLEYGDTPISAGYLSFLFSVALLKRVDDYLLSLGALSTISDMMPLCDYNRELVRLMLEVVNREQYPEFTLLTEKRHFEVSTFQMDIIPKLNAVGRLEKGPEINRLLKYFGDDNSNKPLLANYFNDVNDERKEVTKNASEVLEINEQESAIVVEANIPEGLNGLLASRLLNTYHKPIVVFSKQERNAEVLVGSCRSEEGFDILKAFEGMNTKLISKGGHAFAAGVSINRADFASFKKDFLYAAIKHKLAPKTKNEILINLNECNMQSYRIIETFGPFGFCWETPKFLLKDLDPKTFTYIKDGKYLSVKLTPDTRLFSFSLNKDSFDLDSKTNLSCSFRINEYKGKKNLDILCEKAF